MSTIVEATVKVSGPQLEVLRWMLISGRPLVRRLDGVWCIADDDRDMGRRHVRQDEWRVGTTVVKALEGKKCITRTMRSDADWDDPRILSHLGSTTATARTSNSVLRDFRALREHRERGKARDPDVRDPIPDYMTKASVRHDTETLRLCGSRLLETAYALFARDPSHDTEHHVKAAMEAVLVVADCFASNAEQDRHLAAHVLNKARNRLNHWLTNRRLSGFDFEALSPSGRDHGQQSDQSTGVHEAPETTEEAQAHPTNTPSGP